MAMAMTCAALSLSEASSASRSELGCVTFFGLSFVVCVFVCGETTKGKIRIVGYLAEEKYILVSLNIEIGN